MALKQGLEMTEWQQRLHLISDRDKFLRDNKLWTDCSFKVGQKQKVMRCHKIYLAKSSPVFAAMLFGELANNGVDDIPLPDLQPETFEALLRYIYEGVVDPLNLEVGFELLYAAKKYLLHEVVVQECRYHISRFFQPQNVWFAIQAAESIGEQDIYEAAWELVAQDTEECLRQESWLCVPQHVVQTLLQQEVLKVSSELVLYTACLRWALRQIEDELLLQACGHGTTKLEISTVRDILGPAFSYIRFLAMTPAQFATGPLQDKIFSAEESLSILSHLTAPETKLTPLPSSIELNPSSRVLNIDTFVVTGRPHQFSNWTEHVSNPNVRARYRLGLQQLGVRLPTQVQPHDCDSSTYLEDLTVLLIDEGQKELLSATRFQGRVRYDSTIDVGHKLKPHSKGCTTQFNVGVIFHVSGTYPRNLKEEKTINLIVDYSGKLNGQSWSDAFLAWHDTFRFIDFVICK